MNLRDSILSARGQLKEREVQFFGQKVIVRELTGMERYQMGDAVRTKRDLVAQGQAAVSALIWCVLDPETRKPVFEPADRDTLMSMSGAAVNELISVMNEISGLGPDATPEAEKN